MIREPILKPIKIIKHWQRRKTDINITIEKKKKLDKIFSGLSKKSRLGNSYEITENWWIFIRSINKLTNLYNNSTSWVHTSSLNTSVINIFEHQFDP